MLGVRKDREDGGMRLTSVYKLTEEEVLTILVALEKASEFAHESKDKRMLKDMRDMADMLMIDLAMNKAMLNEHSSGKYIQ